MAVFADAEEVYRYLAGIFRRGLENEDLANRLAGSGVVLRIHYTDPDAVLTVDMPEKVVDRRGQWRYTECRIVHVRGYRQQVLVGEGELDHGDGERNCTSEGPVTKLIKLIPQAKNLFPEYRAILEADKRHDLLNV
jgi:hypothetical protein